MRHHAGPFAAVLATAALVSALGAAIVGYLDQRAVEGARLGLDELSGADLGLQVSLTRADDPEEQDREVRTAIAHTFGTLESPFAVDRYVSGPVDFVRVSDAGLGPIAAVVAASYTDLQDFAELTEGRWQEGAEQLTMQADAADALGVAVGDLVRVGDERAEFTVTGLWRARDPLDPHWLGDGLIVAGRDGRYAGPAAVEEAAWERIGGSPPRAFWNLVFDPAQVVPADLAAIRPMWTGIADRWRVDVDQLGTLNRHGRFDRTAVDLSARIDALHAVEPVALLLLAGIGLVTLGEMARVLGELRRAETALLWARGASPGGLAGRTAAEAAVVAAIGAAAGTLVAAVPLSFTVPAGTGLTAAVAAPGILVVLAAGLVFGASAYRAADQRVARLGQRTAGRVRRVAGGGAVVLLVAAAALSVWQLRLYGSPVTPLAGGGQAVDPVAVLAPALTLLAVVVVGLALFPRVALLAERGGRTVARMLAARSVARRTRTAAASLVAVAAAVGSLVVAAGYGATWSQSFDLSGAVQSGADLRAHTDSAGADDDALTVIAGLPGVAALAPFDIQTTNLGADEATLIAASPAALAEVTAPLPGVFPREEVAAAIEDDVSGGALPDGAQQLALRAAVSGFESPPIVRVLLGDRWGNAAALTLRASAAESGDAAGGAAYDYDAALPAALGLEIVAIDVVGVVAEGSDTARFHVDSLDADGRAIDLVESWDSTAPTGRGFDIPTPTVGAGFEMSTFGSFLVRLIPTPPSPTAPAAVSEALADSAGLRVGDSLTVQLQGASIPFVLDIVSIVPVVPAAPARAAILVDLSAARNLELREAAGLRPVTDFWVATDADAVVVAERIRALLPANSRVRGIVDPGSRAALSSAATALWAAAIGAALLAAIAVAASAQALRRDRRGDAGVLRALGLTAREQGRSRGLELAAVLAYGAVVGALAGAAVVVLTVAALARAAVPDASEALPTTLAVDVVALGAGLAALALALTAIVLAGSARVTADAQHALPDQGAT
jgi:hypothetical protein